MLKDGGLNKKFSDLLMRIAKGGKVETKEESQYLNQLATKIEIPKPKYACPECWLQRLLENLHSN